MIAEATTALPLLWQQGVPTVRLHDLTAALSLVIHRELPTRYRVRASTGVEMTLYVNARVARVGTTLVGLPIAVRAEAGDLLLPLTLVQQFVRAMPGMRLSSEAGGRIARLTRNTSGPLTFTPGAPPR
jgi:hypothetical protein